MTRSHISVITCGGSGEIRTHGTRKGTPVFKTGALNHSATLPEKQRLICNDTYKSRLVRMVRLELTRLAALEPKSSAATNYATSALFGGS